MATVSLQNLTEILELSDDLVSGKDTMFDPQDLPGRFGRVVHAVDRMLSALNCEGLLAGGWAVWRHGYIGRVTQDLDIVLPAGRIEEFLRVAAVSGFDVIPVKEGIWPKVRHRDTGIQVDILPEGGRPGTQAHLAPTLIAHPTHMGARPGGLQYLPLASLIELKLAAGRARDESDVVELLRANPDQIDSLRNHLQIVHGDYVTAFDRLRQRAKEQGES